jgi:choloylglycine hydrolase
MNRILGRVLALSSAFALLLAGSPPARACTSILLRSADGGYVYGRTLEFGLDLRSQLVVIPRKLAITATGPAGEVGKGGLTWTTKYAATGANGLGLPIIVDGVNEKGLAGGLFNFPVYAQFQPVSAKDAARSVASFEVVTWILTSFATVEEIKEALPRIRVSGVKVPQFGNMVPPTHYSFHDTTGQSLVVEYTDGGQLHVYSNPVHVFTNAPAFPFQLENLAQYQYVSADVLPPIQAGSLKLAAASSGDGMNGLPGGWLAPARFVRAFFAQQNAPLAATAAEAVSTSLHILNGFDIPPGSIKTSANAGGEGGGVTGFETTEWTATSDMKNLRYYIRTYANPDVRYVDLRAADLDAKTMRFVPLDQPWNARDLTR